MAELPFECMLCRFHLNSDKVETQNHDFSHFRSLGHFRFVENNRIMDYMGVNRSEIISWVRFDCYKRLKLNPELVIT